MPAAAIDGRRARAERHKNDVVRALLALIRETGDVPTVEAVAGRANISKRTVFRLFEDRAALHHAAVEIVRAEVMSLFPPPMRGEEPLAERVDAVVKHRSDVFEHVTPIRRLAERQRDTVPEIEATMASDRKIFRMHVEMMFGADVQALGDSATTRLDGIEQATSIYAWWALRRDQQCSVEQARAVMACTVRLLVGLDVP